MKLGIISDIHGNHDALAQGLDVLSNVDQIVCLGDAINQHRFSNEVVGLLRERNIQTIWGNHEQVFFSPVGERARQAPWIDQSLLSWLESRPLSVLQRYGDKKILLVHSTPHEPTGGYVEGLGGAFDKQFGNSTADVIFCGHTHVPSVRRAGSTLVVNPGSLGEGRPVAGGYINSCAVFHLDTDTVEIVDLVATAPACSLKNDV